MKKNPNVVSLSSVLSEEQMKKWKALTINSRRSNADAFNLLLDLVIESEKGRDILKIGGYVFPPEVEQINKEGIKGE